MKKIQITKYPDRKRSCIVVYDDETNICYVVAYFNKEENVDLFIEALCDKMYRKEER